MTDTVVAEGQVKFRDGKKWKTRWVVLRKPSPVADCLSLLVYKEKKKGKEKSSCQKERLNVTLEGICGVEPGPGYDGVSYSLSILCLVHTLVLGFSSRDALLAWDARIRYSLGEAHRFSVNVEPGTKLESGSASLHLCNNLLVLSRGLPPLVIGHWKLSALRRYGAVPNGFVFEGGTRCGCWAGVFFLSCSEGEQISFLFDCIVSGVTPSRTPLGLRPKLPADPSADPSSSEERISLETCELEKRLSMLSQCSLACSTASTYSYSTSVAGDDRSSISSSSSSQSDTSYGSRLLTYWVEPLARPHLSGETAPSSPAPAASIGSDDQLYAAVTRGSAGRPSPARLRPRGLHDSGRQSSLDSGIGIAAGSQSSDSGSFSSCTGSLDMAGQGGGEEFGSVASLPAAPSAPPPTPPPSPSPPVSHPDPVSPRTPSSCSCASGPASRRHSAEHKFPSLLQLWYDTPRSLLQALTLRDTSGRGGGRDRGPRAQRQAAMQRSHSWGSERAPSVDSEGSATPTPLLLGTELSHGSDNYITPEQWRSARSGFLFQAENASRPPTSAHAQGLLASVSTKCPENVSPASFVRGEDGDKREGHNRSLSSPPPTAPPPPPPPAAVSERRATSACGVFRSPRVAAMASTPLDMAPRCDSGVNYVNVPFGLLRAKSGELLRAEAELQEARVRVSRLPGGFGGFAHLDAATMERLLRVGAEQIGGRAERMTQLESGRRGPPE